MSLEQAASFLIFSLIAAITPGPSNVMLTAAGATGGVVRGLPCLLGVAAGMGSLLSCVALGIGEIVLDRPGVLRVLNWVGAAFLLWLAWRIATAEPVSGSGDGKPPGFVGAALFQWVNPKSWLVSISAAGAYLSADAGSALPQALAFGILFVLAALPSGFIWLAVGAAMRRLLRSVRAARSLNGIMGAALAASVAMILW